MKTYIRTLRLTIFSLSREHLSDLLDASEKLENYLEYRKSRKIIEKNVNQKIHLKRKIWSGTSALWRTRIIRRPV